MSWGLLVLLASLAVWLLLYVALRISEWAEARSIKRTGRIISWEEALRRVRERSGFLVEDRRTFSPRLWFVPGDPPGEERPVEFCIGPDSLLVTELPGPLAEVLASQEIRDRVRQAFGDPHVFYG